MKDLSEPLFTLCLSGEELLLQGFSLNTIKRKRNK